MLTVTSTPETDALVPVQLAWSESVKLSMRMLSERGKTRPVFVSPPLWRQHKTSHKAFLAPPYLEERPRSFI
jgi:hypothetical protein